MRKQAGLDVREIPSIIVSVDDFFDEALSNEQYFATNTGLSNEKFYALFKLICEKVSVQYIWIEIFDFDPDEDEYPSADVCYIVTTASQDEVWGWFGEQAFPSSISLCNDAGKLGFPPTENGVAMYCC